MMAMLVAVGVLVSGGCGRTVTLTFRDAATGRAVPDLPVTLYEWRSTCGTLALGELFRAPDSFSGRTDACGVARIRTDDDPIALVVVADAYEARLDDLRPDAWCTLHRIDGATPTGAWAFADRLRPQVRLGVWPVDSTAAPSGSRVATPPGPTYRTRTD